MKKILKFILLYTTAFLIVFFICAANNLLEHIDVMIVYIAVTVSCVVLCKKTLTTSEIIRFMGFKDFK